MQFSFLCPVNRQEVFTRFLRASLQLQNSSEFELITADCRAQSSNCAAEVLNGLAKKATGKYLVFAHQDISFGPEFVQRLNEIVLDIDFYIAGVVGAREIGEWHRQLPTNIVHGVQKSIPRWALAIDRPTSCDTVDECLFIIPSEVYRKRQLSVDNKSWHLYAVEYCLWANLQKKGSVVVLPCSLWHASSGASFNASYYKSLDELVKRYRCNYRHICTTMGLWPTQEPAYTIRKLVDKLKHFVRGH